MKLAYRAFEKSGREVSDVIDAPSAAEAAERLRHQDLFVAEIAPAGGARKRSLRRFRLPRGRTRRLKDLAMFTRQLGVLIRAGTPLAEGLRAMERQARDPAWHEAVEDVRRQLEHGVSLSRAMESQPRYFDTVYRNMVAAGELSGKLSTVLDRMSQLARKRLQVRRTFLSAMIYPALLISICLVVFSVMLLVVIPRFGQLFEDLGVPLPATTAVLIGLGKALRLYWWLAIALIAAAGASLAWFLRTPRGRRATDTLVLRLPYVGGLIQGFATSQIARLLGVLLDSHLPVLEALRLTRNVVGNVHYADLIGRAEEAVEQGRPISSAFRDSRLVSPAVYAATRSGEQSGQVSALLLDVADFLDEENEAGLKGLISILEPAILIVMGTLVGIVALSIFTPLFDATGLAGGGGR